MIGIYIFKNIKEKKVYIGQSSRLEERKYNHYHRKCLKDEFHLNLRKNPDDFEYSVIEYCSVEELDDKELYWMNRYKSEGWELYNVCLRKMPNRRGKHHSEEARKKMSESNKGKQAGENNPFYGKHHSEETKKKMSESHIGLQAGENHPFYGKHHSEEARKKISKAAIGRESSRETRMKISEAMKGNQYAKGNHHKLSSETRKKISEAKKGKHWRINHETGKRVWY